MFSRLADTFGLRRKFIRQIAFPAVVVAVTVLLTSSFGLFWAATESDRISVTRQIRTAQGALDNMLGDLAQQQQSDAVWTPMVRHVEAPQLDLNWMDEDIGSWLFGSVDHQAVFILDARNVPIYANINANRASLDSFEPARAAIVPLLEQVRRASDLRSSAPDGEGAETRDRSGPSGHMLPQAVRLSPKTINRTGLAEIDGRPFAVSVMRIAQPGAPHRDTDFVMVSVVPLDEALLKNVADRYMLDDLHFSKMPQSRPKEREIPLQGIAGTNLGYLIWQPELPGTKILHVLVPTSLGLVSILIALIVFLIRKLWHAAKSQASVMMELRASEAQAQHLAFHDVVTGLANRALFDDRLDQAMARAQRGACVALLALDLDRFKHVNDTLGHQAGDALLRELGGRLSTQLRPSDTVARVGGDEFNILLCDIKGSQEAQDIIERILNTVRQPFEIFGHQIFVGISIGMALSPETTTERGELLRKADVALYEAKAAGRNCVRYFTPAMDDSVKLRSRTEDELREALTCPGQLCLYFQPEVSAATRQIIGLEALLRWNHPTRGLIPPDQFIPVAEDTGLINEIGEWVLGEAARTAVRWPGLFMAVNLSPVQFRTTGFAETVMRIVNEAGCEPSRIELEITERVLLDDDERCHETLGRLRAAGFRIALDDFGSGYSSLSYLRRFAVDKIKIDRSYTESLGQTVDSAAIVTSVINLGRLMGLTVTAEGVETHDQMKALRAAGCEELQGHLFSKAVCERDLEILLATRAIDHVA